MNERNANNNTEIKTIGDRIRELREAKSLTQAEVAKKLFVKRETVNQWENNARDLKTQYTIKLADLFEVTCDEILRGIKAENVDINKKLGLEDKAIEMLKYCSQSIYHRDIFAIRMVNKLLSDQNKNGLEFLCNMWMSLFAEISDVSVTDDGERISFGISNSDVNSYDFSIRNINLIFQTRCQENLIALKQSHRKSGEIA